MKIFDSEASPSLPFAIAWYCFTSWVVGVVSSRWSLRSLGGREGFIKDTARRVGVNASRLLAIITLHNAPDFCGHTDLEIGFVLELGDIWSGGQTSDP